MENEQIEQFKVWPTKMDQPQFSDVIMSISTDDLLGKYTRSRPKMIEAYIFFSGSINEYLRDEQYTQDSMTRLEALYQALRKDLEVVTIELEGNDDAQVIFETLNARGEPLLPFDLLRNYLFMRAAQNKESQDFLYEKYWEQFDHHYYRLGVLSCSPRPLNSSISNDVYSNKKPDIIRQSALRLNTYFHDLDTWDEAAIRQRGQTLFQVAKRIWPHPGSN